MGKIGRVMIPHPIFWGIVNGILLSLELKFSGGTVKWNGCVVTEGVVDIFKDA